ncbi:hypothetical protein [Streptomyces sp. NPDC057690]|uniref:hypothetical protein n=1 Tax=Streptomyces sp. NPDC057690 TaxID=3346214 RepID=UPI0036CD694C
MSAHFGKAQLFFHSEQNDGESWLIAERGRILRRWIGDPEGLRWPRGKAQDDATVLHWDLP